MTLRNAALALVLGTTSTAAAPLRGVETDIMAAMNDSAAGWNTGDLDRFMRIYSDAQETSFAVKDGVIKGKAAIAARYRQRFTPAAAATRGTLSFETLRFVPIDARHALLIARYRLKMTGKPDQSGPTTLLFVREAGGWKIAADHSS